ncbi:MAG: site-2 protease family protein [Bacteroidales bacterium]
MKYSLTLGRPFGIRISVHWTFLLIIAWIVFINLQQGLGLRDILYSVLFVLSIFVCVVLHELSHSLTARRYGIPTRSITLLPIGGVADLEKMPEDPRQELMVSVAGPLLNLAITLFLWIVLSTTGQLDLNPANFQVINESNFLVILMFANLMLAVFNLIPAFPMDGGRVFRSLLAMKLPRDQATLVAMNIGKIFAFFIAIWGLYANPFLIFIAIFIYIGAQREYEMVKYTSVLTGYTVDDVLMHEYTPLHPHDTLKRAVDILLDGTEQRFIVTHDDRVMGVLTRNDIIEGLMKYDENTEVGKIMNPNVTVFQSSLSLEEAYETMRYQQITMAPVVDNDKVKGLIDMENINEFIMVRTAMRRTG